MAYIKKEAVAAIRAALKKEFPKFVFSVVREHHSAVRVAIMKGDVDFGVRGDGRTINHFKKYKEDPAQCVFEDEIAEQPFAKLFNKIIEIAKSQGWYDRSDGMTDYFDTAYYITIQIGKWDKPYEVKAK